ncbi:MAG: DUF4412 domain-containing protein [Candidatus Chlorobium antarcticum]|jgi:hypothetical protein|nr:DUF4412 domain-containing protein [Candidatus Chlorobium antarcticum]
MKQIQTPMTIPTTTMKKTTILFILLLLALPNGYAKAAEKFSGVMEMMLTMPSGKGELTFSFGSAAQRMDMFLQMDNIPAPVRSTILTRASEPDRATLLNHDTRSFAALDLKNAAEEGALLDFDGNYSLEKLGTVKLHGYSCQLVRLSSRTEKLELWLTRDLGSFASFSLLQRQNPHFSNSALSKKLAAAGIDGFPVKTIQRTQNGTYTMELVKAWPKIVPDSQFQVPAGYTRISAEAPKISKSQKEHLKNLMEKMKKFDQ